MSLAFDGASAATLRKLALALGNGQLAPPISSLAIQRVAPASSEALASELMRLSSEGMRPDHLALLMDAMAKSHETRLAGGAELVWTGPESPVSQSRDTSIVVAELFRSATRSVLISTFVIKQARSVFESLARRMTEVPNLKVQLFVHVGRGDRDTRHESEILREFAASLGAEWHRYTSPHAVPRSALTSPRRQSASNMACQGHHR